MVVLLMHVVPEGVVLVPDFWSVLPQAATTAALRISNGRKVRDMSFLGRGFRTSPDVAQIAQDTESFTLESPQLVVNRNNNFTGAPVANNLLLRGAGLSLDWQQGAGVNLKATWARRMGDNPNPTATGTDQDGTLVLDRMWLNASLAF